ncbi:hypothetical protein WMF30_02960 [Sorangium sp. So ce134]
MGGHEASAALSSGHDRAIQGNLDPFLLCAPPDVAAARARTVLAEAAVEPIAERAFMGILRFCFMA